MLQAGASGLHIQVELCAHSAEHSPNSLASGLLPHSLPGPSWITLLTAASSALVPTTLRPNQLGFVVL